METCSPSFAPFFPTRVFRFWLVLLSHRPNILPMAFPKGVFYVQSCFPYSLTIFQVAFEHELHYMQICNCTIYAVCRLLVLGEWIAYQTINDLCQQSFTKVIKWCDKWGFQISQSKSAAVLFTNKRNLPPICLKLQKHSIPVRKEYKFLGIIFQRNGTYHSHIQRVHSKCLKRLNLLWMLTGTTWGAAKKPLLHIYQALVRSVLEYGM